MAARARTTLSCLNEHKRARESTNSSKSHSIQKLRIFKKRRDSENIKIMQGTYQDDDIKTCERLDSWHSSIGLLQHLYTVTPTHTTLVQETLTRLLLISDVTLKGKVTGHGRRQVRATNDWAQPIDWTGLETPVPTQNCKLVRQRKTDESNNYIASHLQTIKKTKMENMNNMNQIKPAPHFNTVTNHARRLLRTSNYITKSTDWNDLETLAYVCEAIRHLQELQQFQAMEELPQY